MLLKRWPATIYDRAALIREMQDLTRRSKEQKLMQALAHL